MFFLEMHSYILYIRTQDLSPRRQDTGLLYNQSIHPSIHRLAVLQEITLLSYHLNSSSSILQISFSCVSEEKGNNLSELHYFLMLMIFFFFKGFQRDLLSFHSEHKLKRTDPLWPLHNYKSRCFVLIILQENKSCSCAAFVSSSQSLRGGSLFTPKSHSANLHL